MCAVQVGLLITRISSIVNIQDWTGVLWHNQTGVIVCWYIKVGHVTAVCILAVVQQVELTNLHMIRFDFLNIVEHKLLIILAIVLERLQVTNVMVHINQ